MNFVIVAPSFYPWPSAEGYCSTRFASALAKAGHQVEVITNWRPDDMYEKSYQKLVHPAVKITRVGPCTRVATKWPYVDWKWVTVMEPETDLIAPYVKATREALSRYEQPILISRTHPWLAFYAGWYCRKQAAKWVAHFSDPMLDVKPFCRLARLMLWSLKWWMRRAMRKADAISVTCKRVKWYYQEQLGSCVDRAKFILTTHIGDFKLDDKKVEKKGGGGGRDEDIHCQPTRSTSSLIVHDGDIYYGRGLQILEAVKNLNEQGVAVEFIQGRRVKNEGDRKKILETPHCFILDENATDELRERAKAAQVSFVADFNMPGLSYSTHLMSKFVYQLFTDKPMVVFAKVDSEKHDYCVAYPEAGLFFADMNEPGSLEKAIKAALACDPKAIDRSRIRERFSEEHIAAEFIEQLECDDLALLKDKWMSRV